VRDAQANLDLDLGRIKRRKRFGLLLTALGVLFVALVLAPVTWALAYLFFDPPSTVLMLQRAAEGQVIHHTPVPINRVSPFVIRSVIAAEDSNFCTHHGFDVNAIQDAMESNAEGGRMRGGSTISQQTAKNLFLWPQRSWVRKGFETYFTALIEFMWPKHRIMEAYLNSAEWGDGNFGIEAAARARIRCRADAVAGGAARCVAAKPQPLARGQPRPLRSPPCSDDRRACAGGAQQSHGFVRAGHRRAAIAAAHARFTRRSIKATARRLRSWGGACHEISARLAGSLSA
jgi:monofunctional biosynthetic peptidoglycan transglycosylase